MSTASSLRICSLLPSATEIIGRLKLEEHLVAISHECDICGELNLDTTHLPRVTTSEINPLVLSQGEIDAMVNESMNKKISLYTLKEKELEEASPTVIFTQALCNVCAPSHSDVINTCNQFGNMQNAPKIVNLEPSCCLDISNTFVDIATHCNVRDRGETLKREFLKSFELITQICSAAKSKKKVLLMEWTDPPFDGGHWIPEMIEYANSIPVFNKTGDKSKQRSWEEIEETDPDVVIVACCGFDLKRNVKDTQTLLHSETKASKRFLSLRAVKDGNLFAVDGNRFFARPGPSVSQGCAIIARCAFNENQKIISELQTQGLMPKNENDAWCRIDSHLEPQTANKSKTSIRSYLGVENGIPDMEDYNIQHERACSENKMSYIDASSGYHVFTRLAHEKRGKCCGSGCRHCPFDYINVKDKAARIKQSSLLYERKTTAKKTKQGMILFWSGGKDSYLTLRALIRRHGPELLDSLYLLTTFSGQSRTVAHQEVLISEVQKQAEYLNLNLLGVPLYGSSNKKYIDNILEGLQFLRTIGVTIKSFAFGDLHLNHIKNWRDGTFQALKIDLIYPLFEPVPKSNYDFLLNDLMASTTPIEITACEGDFSNKGIEFWPVKIGDLYNRDTFERLKEKKWDEFGENGEFHTIAQVWKAKSAEIALGL